MTPIAFVTAPLPTAWTELAQALAQADIVAVAADLRADTTQPDPRAALDALVDRTEGDASDGDGARRGRVAGPASGGARAGGGKAALVTRLGPAFEAAARGLDLAEAVDLGLAWDLDEADLVRRWAARGDLTVIGLASPRPSARLAAALRDVQGRIAVVVADPAQRAWYHLGAAVVPSLEALRLALALPSAAGTHMAVVGTSGPGLAALAEALDAVGVTFQAPTRTTRPVIAQEVHARAELGAGARPVVDLLGVGTARHVALAASVMRETEDVQAVVVLGEPLPAADARLGADAPPVFACPPEADPWAFAVALRARREAAGELYAEPLPAPAADAGRAQALIAAALVMKRRQLERSEALGVAQAMGFGRAATSVQVAGLAAAQEAAQRLGFPVALGAPGVATEPGALADAAALEERWEAIADALAEAADPFVARWVAAVPAGAAPLALTIEPGEVGPVGAWQAGDDGSSVVLPAREVDAGGPAGLLGAASALVRAFPDVERLAVVGFEGPDGPVLVDATLSVG